MSIQLIKLTCRYCDYQRIVTGPIAAPGGTLGCSNCRLKKQNGPGLEGTYGSIKKEGVEVFTREEIIKALDETEEKISMTLSCDDCTNIQDVCVSCVLDYFTRCLKL